MAYLIRPLVGLLGLSVALSNPVSALPVTGCQNQKTGAFRFARKCRNNELPLTLVTTADVGTTGLQGPPGPQGPKGDPGSSATIGVYDNNNQFLGYLLATIYNQFSDRFTEVYIPSLQAQASFTENLASYDGVHRTGDIDLYLPPQIGFTSTDCSGTPYYLAGFDAFPEIAKSTADGSYFLYKEQSPVPQTIASYVNAGICIPLNAPVSLNLVPGFDRTKVTLPFTAPVAYPLHFQ